jgi:hypothetical protein
MEELTAPTFINAFKSFKVWIAQIRGWVLRWAFIFIDEVG